MRNFLVAFLATMEGPFDMKDHINSVGVSHKGMPSMVTLKRQISEALEASEVHPGYMVFKVTILAITELSKEDMAALIEGDDDIIFVELE